MDLINILFAKALNNGDTTKEYVDEAIKALKGEVNADLDTLEELSKALGNDPDFFLSVKNELDEKITQEEFNSTIENLVSISNYNPIDKTDSMTQPVGKSADGKLWTSPGSGTGSAEAVLYTLQSLTNEQQAQARENIAAAGKAEVNKLSEENAEIKDDLSDLAPAGAAVGQLFRVAAISEDGKYTMEPVDMPVGGVTDVTINGESIVSDGVARFPFANGFGRTGIVRLADGLGIKWSDVNGGGLSINYATTDQINRRTSSNEPMIPYYLDTVVKVAMCDGKGAAWTDAERIAALLRLGCTVDDNGFVKWGASE